MSEIDPKEIDPPKRSSAAPTPEAHGNRDAKGSASRQPESPESSEQDDLNRVKATLEALLLAGDERLDRKTLQKCLPEEDHPLINGALENLRLEYSGPGRGIHLVEVAGGFQLRTNPDFSSQIRLMFEAAPRKLSRAALETLAIIAYRQPLTRADVEEIRGVDSSGVIRTLEDHELVRTIGRLDDLGRPHIYGTTRRFLEFFGLDDLADLPTLSASELEALDEMYADEMRAQQESEQESKQDSKQTELPDA
jgi:segregation and condensation protein B